MENVKNKTIEELQNSELIELLLNTKLPINTIAKLFKYKNTELSLMVLELAKELTLVNNKNLAGILEKKVEQSKPKFPLVKEKQREYYRKRTIYRNQCKNNCNQ
jgi:hypothetical protein